MHSQLHDDRSKSLSDIVIVPMFRCKLRNGGGWLFCVARRAAVHILGDVEKATLDPRAWRSLRAVTSVTVVALVIVII